MQQPPFVQQQKQRRAAAKKPLSESSLIPLSLILAIALAVRLLAVFFSRGYAFHDDHFDVIAIAQNWVYNLPYWLTNDMPPRHSMFYTGIHYGLLYAMQAAGIHSPDTMMLLIRLLHGLYSLLIVYFGYKITERVAGRLNARLVGLVLALLWFMPFMSVRNLVEMVSIPPYLTAFYLLLKYDQQENRKPVSWLLPGALFALAFVLRYHTALFAAGAGLVLFYRREWRQLAWFGLGFVLVAFAIQGTIDLVFFDYPFESVITYFFFNAQNAYGYSTGPAYRFVLTVVGFLVPPVSIFMLLGYARTRQAAPMLFWGGLLFFVAHSLFPNKQERFIFPLLPLVVVLGVVGWQQFVQQSPFWLQRRRWLAYSWRFFWAVNVVVAIGLSLTYSKKSRIAPLVYLSEKENLQGVLLEAGEHAVRQPPLFYLGRMSETYEEFQADKYRAWHKYKTGTPLPNDFVMVYTLDNQKPVSQLQQETAAMQRQPEFVVMTGNGELQERLQRLRQLYPALTLDTTMAPSRYDQLLTYLNPRVHKNEEVRIYRTGKN